MVPPQEPQITHVMATAAVETHNNNNKKEPHLVTLDQLVKNIHRALGPDGGLDSEHIDANEIMRLMEEYSSNATDWEKYTLFDHSRAYTRNLIDDGNGKFNLMILAWSKGQQSPIHNHSNSHCIMKVLDGQLQETQYEWPLSSSSSDDDAICKNSNTSSSGDTVAGAGNGVRSDNHQSSSSSDITEAVQSASSSSEIQKGKPLAIHKCTRLHPNEVTYIHDKIGLHRISNPDQGRGAVSLHLYTPPYQVCKTFEENTGRARMGGKCTFYSIAGTRCCDADHQ
ncbi:RmlC-like cupin domain-containing protein [Zychaea mexicana]|uniref:RmlC-like cupin domain-containing protein n=1 Tax=Zychaea mexicana TaxID=64656 RepID=UPI0022FE6C64|nr:RmlC-like cupin domain-containing protein [Zychaea mexicana]KAI9495636.1 RmlC-like cupin domain-containing protein [Zychaea mexicana]